MLIVLPPYPTIGRSNGMPIRVDGRPGIACNDPPRTSKEQFSFTLTCSCGRATSRDRRDRASGPAAPPAIHRRSSAGTSHTRNAGRIPSPGVASSPSSPGNTPPAARARRFPARRRAPVRAVRSSPDASAFTACAATGVRQQIVHIVCQRPPEQEFHREVINLLGILAAVRPLGEQPSLRENVPHRRANASNRSRASDSGISTTLSKTRCRS